MTTPSRLTAVIKSCNGRYHAIAKKLTQRAEKRGLPKVNVYYVYRYIRKGIEPRNPDVRKAMYLPKLRNQHNGRSGFGKLAASVQWWRKLKKDERDQWIGKCHNAHLRT